jgi:dTDP-4-dehydrorhamnose 3,5-epimerase-like enzyme
MLGKVTRVKLKENVDYRGILSVMETGTSHADNPALPFPAQRIYILHGQRGTQLRGAHAHKTLRQVIFAMSGNVKIEVDNGRDKQTFHLNSPNEAIVIEPVIWRDIEMPEGAVVAVLASDQFDEGDYIRDYRAFTAFVEQLNS